MAKAKEPATAREVREWAAGKGYEVAERGRLSAEVKAAFTKQTRRPIAAA